MVIGLARALQAAGVDSDVAALVHESADHPFLSFAASQGVRVRAIHSAHRGFRQQIRLVAAEAVSSGATVIHTHGYHADVIGALAGRRQRIPVVATLHGFSGEGWRLAAYDVAVRWAHRHAARMIAVSAPIAHTLRKRRVRAERIAIIPNAILSGGNQHSRLQARAELGVSDSGTRVGWIGRLSPEKAPDLFLRALAKLDLPFRSASIIGDGAMRPELEQQAKALGIQDRVSWHGMIAGASRLLPALDVLVLSSRTEGTPMVLLEAMSAGIPIVTTAVGGVPDMLTSDEALLVPRDDPDALALAVASALADPSGAALRASRARGRVERDYSVPSWVEKHISLYREVVDERRR